jgi:hypothetical protein
MQNNLANVPVIKSFRRERRDLELGKIESYPRVLNCRVKGLLRK